MKNRGRKGKRQLGRLNGQMDENLCNIKQWNQHHSTPAYFDEGGVILTKTRDVNKAKHGPRPGKLIRKGFDAIWLKSQEFI